MHWELSTYTNESLLLKFWCGLYLNSETNKKAVPDPQLTILSDTRSPFKTLKLTRLFKVSHQIFISYMTYTSQNWYLTEILWRFGENESQRSVISSSDFTLNQDMLLTNSQLAIWWQCFTGEFSQYVYVLCVIKWILVSSSDGSEPWLGSAQLAKK